MATSLTSISQEISIYFGLVAFITGSIGGLFNIIVFLSLKTFRKNSCAFYLTILSIVNIGTLTLGQLTRILISGYRIDWTQSSLIYCKLRIYILQTCALISMTCICLAIIDQYFSTSSHLQWQQWSKIKIAHRLSGVTIFFWFIINIPYLIYYTHVQLSYSTNQTLTCSTTNVIFQQYVNYVSALGFSRILPLIILITFGLLSYKNIHQLSHRALPVIRRELEKQLTLMVFTQVFITLFILSPYIIVYFLLLIPNLDSISLKRLQFVSSICSAISYFYFSSPFYIYFCSSNRFRRQLKYVLFDIYYHRWRTPQIHPNQIEPQILS